MNLRKIAPVVFAVSAILAAPALTACSAEARPYSFSAATKDYRVSLSLDSTSMGRRDAVIRVARLDGQKPDISRVTITTAMASMGMTGSEVAARPTGQGRFEATADLFAMEGQWSLTVTIVDGAGIETTAIPVTATP